MGEQIHYLDHAAATPCDERVVQAMLPYFQDVFYNPSSVYEGGRIARRALDQAREDIAAILGAKPNDIVFTAGATESINLALKGIIKPGGHVVISGVEHAAVREVAKSFPHTIAKVDKRGYVTPGAIAAAVNDETVLVSVTLADNEFGTVQPIADIAHELQKIRNDRELRGIKNPLYLHSDGSQAAVALDLKVSRLGVDMLTLNAGKCYGPKQVGLLWSRSTIKLAHFIEGGGQEKALRSGTENVSGAVGFALALKIAQTTRHEESKRLSEIRMALKNMLVSQVEGLVVDGHPKKHLPGHLHVHVKGLDAERVLYHLDNKGVFIATGSACAANKGTHSPSLEAVGLAPDEADGSLRISLGHSNNIEDVPEIAEKIVEAITKERLL